MLHHRPVTSQLTRRLFVDKLKYSNTVNLIKVCVLQAGGTDGVETDATSGPEQ